MLQCNYRRSRRLFTAVGPELWKCRLAVIFPQAVVDNKSHPAHIARVGAPPLGAMARLRSSSLNIRWQSFRLRSAAGGFDALWRVQRVGDQSSVPGCLTSESEERETWTAESLRAASRAGKPAGVAVGRDFGGRRFRSTLVRERASHASDLSWA
jgi:hypothetical protein